MKSISHWASRHLWPARLLLFALFILLNLIAVFTGFALADLGVELPSYLVYLLLLPFAIAWMSHPGRRKSNNFYVRKRCEGVVMAVTFLTVVCMSNQPVVQGFGPLKAWPSFPVIKNDNTPAVVQGKNTKPASLKKKVVRQLQKSIQTLRKQYHQGPTGVKIGLIILSVLIALGLLMLLSALACNLACAGSEALALFVSILGTGLIVFLLVRVIKSLNRQHKKPGKQTSAPKTNT